MSCKPTRYPNGLEVGKCLLLVDGATVVSVDKIVEIDSDYQLVGDEDIISCTGALTITLIPVSDSVKDVTIDADGGTVNFAAIGGDLLEAPNVVSGNKVRIYGKKSTNTWRTA